MPVHDQGTMTDHYSRRRGWSGVTLRDLLSFFGSLAVPLMLGIFTVVITFDQRQDARKQRVEDRQQATLQREQDLSISRDQRLDDRNNSALQRELDKIIADQKRAQDYEIADKVRNTSWDQRVHELLIEEKRYNESEKRYNESEKQRELDRRLAATERQQDLNISTLQREQDKVIAEMKRNADDLVAERYQNMSRELEEYRYAQEKERYLDTLLLSHINEIGQMLKENNASLTYDLTIAAIARAKTLHVIRSIGIERSFQLIQFLYDAKQLHSNNRPLDLSGAKLDKIDLSISKNGLLSMRGLYLGGVHMDQASFHGQDVSYWDFTGAHLNNANFSRSNCTNSIFDRALLNGADLSHVIWSNTTFRHADLTVASFSGSFGKKFEFEYAKLERVNFTSVTFATYPSTLRFFKSELAGSIFRGAALGTTDFEYCNLTKSDFGASDIGMISFFGSTLAFANLVNARMDHTSIEYANLSHANMSGANCYNLCTLEKVLSIHNAILPNNTLGPPNEPLIRNGIPLCNESMSASWNVTMGSIKLRPYSTIIKCAFVPVNISVSSSMTQYVNLNFLARIISKGNALVSFRARISMETIITLLQVNLEGRVLVTTEQRSMIDWTDNFVSSTIRLHQRTTQLAVTINFPVNIVNQNYCEFVELNIDPALVD